MPPILRPRPNVAPPSPPSAVRRSLLPAKEHRAPKATGPGKRAPQRPQDRSGKEKEPKQTKAPQTSKVVGVSRKSRPSGPLGEVQTLNQPEAQKPKQRPRKPGKQKKAPSESEPVTARNRVNAKSIRSAQISSWVDQVDQETLPPIVDLPTVNQTLTSDSYLRSTPWYRHEACCISDEDMASTSGVTTEAGPRSRRPTRFRIENENITAILGSRNVKFARVDDQDKEWIEGTILLTSGESCSAEEENCWSNDLSKCQVSDEAIFQRTIMMDMINRHQLADALDYTCESPWSCPSSIPHRNSELASRMPRPKPDLAVAFKADSLLSTFKQEDLDKWRSIMCPESTKEVKRDRAFHFLSVEAKGASGQLANWTAHRQNFNTATEALHNIYFFMKRAGKEMLDAFYKKVRFYSIVATSEIFHVRVHRAVELEEGRVEESYPLGFVYDVVHNHKGSAYTKTEAKEIIKNILVGYGMTILQPLLQQSLEKVWGNLKRKSKENGVRNEAEEQRSHARAASRNSREASTGGQYSRKTPSMRAADTSFTRQELGGLTVTSSDSSPLERRASG